MKCSHCMRGDAQDINITNEYIVNILKYIGQIYQLTITGGEPSLNVNGIKFLLKELKRRKISVERFYIATNGSESSMSNEFTDICTKLYDYQETKQEEAMLEMSNDHFHNRELHETVFAELSKYPFFSNRYSFPDGFSLIKEGRSKVGYENIILPLGFYDNCRIEGDFYLNALGYIICNDNLSYENQDKLSLCHSKDIITYLKSIH
ncbi:MAG: 7-carboxy-7-deazaguanine synthase [Candidatus Ordinivivax streblomastigis]|uniref:7-carboxy-7-deazaguanine synthase n=1 Tax=Candidatus Ordinivivax streblomastigis TaxID=2540710 RepID=A0A5M8P373_9BACT|nr:MAG: 7-carboxy-7-deazaguanine synthase [Candidatus Ordinivivax streblomastigis]